MHIELSERLATNVAPEAVMEFAARQFSKISDKTKLRDGRLTVKAVEATFGSINRSDFTEVSIQRVEGGYLLVSETNYRPSIWFWLLLIVLLFTYVGWLIPIAFYLYQKSTVKSAIQTCFDRIRNEFSSPAAHALREPATANYLDDLKKLANLRESGILSEEEFEQQKRKLLAGN